jgi:hypothetical protein
MEHERCLFVLNSSILENKQLRVKLELKLQVLHFSTLIIKLGCFNRFRTRAENVEHFFRFKPELFANVHLEQKIDTIRREHVFSLFAVFYRKNSTTKNVNNKFQDASDCYREKIDFLYFEISAKNQKNRTKKSNKRRLFTRNLHLNLFLLFIKSVSD